MTKLIVAFRNFAKTPKKFHQNSLKTEVNLHCAYDVKLEFEVHTEHSVLSLGRPID